MKKVLPIAIFLSLLFPLMAQAGFLDVIGDILQYILCIVTGIACPNPCLVLISQTGGTAAYRLCMLVDRISTALYIIGWSLALIVILWGGISIMVAGGNEDQLKRGKTVIKNGLIGAAIVLCSGFILSLLVQFLYPLFAY